MNELTFTLGSAADAKPYLIKFRLSEPIRLCSVSGWVALNIYWSDTAKATSDACGTLQTANGDPKKSATYSNETTVIKPIN